MSSLSQSLNADLSGYSEIEQSVSSVGAAASAPSTDKAPGFPVFMRCPLPPIWSTTPDSLRQYFQNGVVPQYRLYTPSIL